LPGNDIVVAAVWTAGISYVSNTCHWVISIRAGHINTH